MIVNDTEVKELKECSGALWRTFKNILSQIDEEKNPDRIFELAFNIFGEKVKEYKGTHSYSYAVQYSQTLIYEIERLLYKERCVHTNYSEVKRMSYSDFTRYIWEANPGDSITVVIDDGTQIRTHIEEVIAP